MKILKQATIQYTIQQARYGLSAIDNIAAKTENISNKILTVNSVINHPIIISTIGITTYVSSLIIPAAVAGTISTTAIPIISGTVTIIGGAATIAAVTKVCSMGTRIAAYTANTATNIIENNLLTEHYQKDQPNQDSTNNNNGYTLARFSEATQTIGRASDYGHFITKVTSNTLEHIALSSNIINESLNTTIDAFNDAKKIGMLKHVDKVPKMIDNTKKVISAATSPFKAPPIKLPRSIRQCQPPLRDDEEKKQNEKPNNKI